jgi:hypothetical protein
LIGLFKAIVAGLLGLVLGLGATWLVLEREMHVGETHLGPWRTNPRAAFADADPYSRAERARTGASPLSQAEGMTFIAARDSDGDRLDPRCDYVFGGAVPAARLWTLSSINRAGWPVGNGTGRNAISSAEVTRDQEGRFEVIASAKARSGNWLPIAADAPFQFMLRLYDTSGSAAAGVMSQEQMPSLRRGACS